MDWMNWKRLLNFFKVPFIIDKNLKEVYLILTITHEPRVSNYILGQSGKMIRFV